MKPLLERKLEDLVLDLCNGKAVRLEALTGQGVVLRVCFIDSNEEDKPLYSIMNRASIVDVHVPWQALEDASLKVGMLKTASEYGPGVRVSSVLQYGGRNPRGPLPLGHHWVCGFPVKDRNIFQIALQKAFEKDCAEDLMSALSAHRLAQAVSVSSPVDWEPEAIL